MKAKEALLLARKYNENCNYRYALKILKPLYKELPNSVTVLRELSDALLGDGDQEQAIKCITKAIKISPNNAELWISRSWMHRDEDIDARIADLDNALILEPKNIDTLTTKANALIEKGLLEEASEIYQTIIALVPNKKYQFIEARAANLMSKAVLVGDTENVADTQVALDTTGMRYSIPHLEYALADYTALIDRTGDEWLNYFKRGEIFKLLRKYENALVDFDIAEQNIDGRSKHIYLDLIREYREQCIDGGKNHRKKLAELVNQSFTENGNSFNHGNLSAAENLVSATINRVNDGEDLNEAVEQFVTDNPEDQAALKIARSIFNVGIEPTPELIETNPKRYSFASQRYCKKIESALGHKTFVPLGYYTPMHLNETLGKPALMRILLGDDGTIVVSAYKAYPSWPGVKSWLSLRSKNKWHKPNILQLQTSLSNGSFVVTDNTENLDPFDYGPKVDRYSLPLNTTPSHLLEIHQHRVEETLEHLGSVALIPCATIEDVMETQEQLRREKSLFRKSINYGTEDELQSLLDNEYEKIGENVKSKLALIVETSS